LSLDALIDLRAADVKGYEDIRALEKFDEYPRAARVDLGSALTVIFRLDGS
jgi:hypothetical protein